MIVISIVEEFSTRLLALKKDILTLQPLTWRGQVCFKDNEIPLFILLPQNIVMPTKNLRLVLILLRKLVFIFVSGKFCEMGTGAQKGIQV